MISLSFYGAAGTVTGSKYLLRAGNKSMLIDCGMFQGSRDLRQRNWNKLQFDPSELSAVLLTHAHIDHSGFLPRLVTCGYTGPVFALPPTIDMVSVLLADSAHIQEEDAAYRNKKGLTRHKPARPLFTTDDVAQTKSLFKPVPYDKWTQLGDEFRFRYHRSGHLLGAGSIEIVVKDGKEKKSILFSGDVGRYAVPLVIDPSEPPETDYLVCESTYGGELHPPADPFFELSKLINDVVERKSILLIPAFAIGRTQQLTYMLNVLVSQKQIPPIPVHIDSPMAVRATDIYTRFPGYHSINIKDLKEKKCSLYGKNVTLHRKRKSSKTLNKLKGPAVILSASGMLTGGRILHHLINRLPDPNTTLALVGFMARGTLGRRILEGERKVFIHKNPVEVNAEIVTRSGLSGHGDYLELAHWLEPIKRKPARVFVTHGEAGRSKAFADYLKKERGWDCHIPELDETVEL